MNPRTQSNSTHEGYRIDRAHRVRRMSDSRSLPSGSSSDEQEEHGTSMPGRWMDMMEARIERMHRELGKRNAEDGGMGKGKTKATCETDGTPASDSDSGVNTSWEKEGWRMRSRRNECRRRGRMCYRSKSSGCACCGMMFCMHVPCSSSMPASMEAKDAKTGEQQEQQKLRGKVQECQGGLRKEARQTQMQARSTDKEQESGTTQWTATADPDDGKSTECTEGDHSISKTQGKAETEKEERGSELRGSEKQDRDKDQSKGERESGARAKLREIGHTVKEAAKEIAEELAGTGDAHDARERTQVSTDAEQQNIRNENANEVQEKTHGGQERGVKMAEEEAGETSKSTATMTGKTTDKRKGKHKAHDSDGDKYDEPPAPMADIPTMEGKANSASYKDAVVTDEKSEAQSTFTVQNEATQSKTKAKEKQSTGGQEEQAQETPSKADGKRKQDKDDAQDVNSIAERLAIEIIDKLTTRLKPSTAISESSAKSVPTTGEEAVQVDDQKLTQHDSLPVSNGKVDGPQKHQKRNLDHDAGKTSADVMPTNTTSDAMEGKRESDAKSLEIRTKSAVETSRVCQAEEEEKQPSAKSEPTEQTESVRVDVTMTKAGIPMENAKRSEKTDEGSTKVDPSEMMTCSTAQSETPITISDAKSQISISGTPHVGGNGPQRNKGKAKDSTCSKHLETNETAALDPARKAYIDTVVRLLREYPDIVRVEAERVNAALDRSYDHNAQQLDIQTSPSKDGSCVDEEPHQDGDDPTSIHNTTSSKETAKSTDCSGVSGADVNGADTMMHALRVIRQDSGVRKERTECKGECSLQIKLKDRVLERLAKSKGAKVSAAEESCTRDADDLLLLLINALASPLLAGDGQIALKGAEVKASAKDADDRASSPVRSTSVAATTGSPQSIISTPNTTPPVQHTTSFPATLPVEAVKHRSPLIAEAIKAREARVRPEDPFKTVKDDVVRNLGSIKGDWKELKHGASSKVDKLVSVLKRGGSDKRGVIDGSEIERQNTANRRPDSRPRRETNVRFNPEVNVLQIDRSPASISPVGSPQEQAQRAGSRNRGETNAETKTLGAINGQDNVYARIANLTRRLSET